MKAIEVIGGLVAIFIYAPIWYWLVYQILKRIDASELMWFLFWIYVPVGIFIGILGKIPKWVTGNDA